MPDRLKSACEKHLNIRPCLCYDQVFKSGFLMTTHRHLTLELMYAVEGSFDCVFIKDRTITNTVTVQKGQMLLINTSEYHKFIIAKDVRIQNIEFEFTEAKPDSYPTEALVENVPGFLEMAEDDADWFLVTNCRKWSEIFSPLFDIMTLPDELFNKSLTSNQLIIQLSTGIFWTKLALIVTAHEVSQKTDIYINQAKDYLEENFDENITVADIAAHVGLHPVYLETLFKRGTAISLIDYLNKLRIAKSCLLLRTTQKNIEDIGYETGFNSRQYFTRIFRIITGQSPSDYRKNQKITNYIQDDLYMLDRLPDSVISDNSQIRN